MRIDAHQHFWHFNEQEYGWNAQTEYILRQDYLPAHLEYWLRDNGLAGSVAVQVRQTVAENDYLIGLAKDNDIIKGIVGWLDLTSDNLLEYLDRYQGKLCGLRHIIHDESSVDFMLKDDFLRGIGMLSKFNYTYDLLVRPEHLGNCLTLVDQFPDQKFVIDHIAKPSIGSAEISPWKEDISKLAERKNVFCKLSGMVTEANYNAWGEEELPLDDFIPYMDIVLEAFSASRLMYGSDWPVCTLASTYDEVYDIVNEYIARLSREEQTQIMGETATAFYNLNSRGVNR
jgi:L-fuconolactonase